MLPCVGGLLAGAQRLALLAGLLQTLTLPPSARPPFLAPPCPRSNEDVVTLCKTMASQSCDAIAAELAKQAVAKGSTDDVTVVALKLT